MEHATRYAAGQPCQAQHTPWHLLAQMRPSVFEPSKRAGHMGAADQLFVATQEVPANGYHPHTG